jgi:hypothetical protein
MKYDNLNKAELLSKIEELELDLIKSNNINKKLEKAEEISREQSPILKFINSMAIPTADKSSVEEFSKILLRAVKDYTGADLAIFSLYLPYKKELLLLHIEVNQNTLKKVVNLVGNKILKTSSPVDDETYKIIINNPVVTFNTFTEVTFGAIPKVIDRTIRKITGIDRLYPIAHVIEGELYGTTLLGFNKEHRSPSLELLESYGHLISVSLRRYNAEKALKESEDNFREMFRNMGHGACRYKVIDNGNDFIFADINEAGEVIAKVKKSNILGKSIFEVRPNSKKYGLTDVFKKVWETGKPETYKESFYQDEDLTGYFTNYVYKLRSGDIVAIFEDLTENKQTEEAVKISEKRYRGFIDNLKAGVVVHAPDTSILLNNKKASELLGLSDDQLKGKKAFDPDWRFTDINNRILTQEKYPANIIQNKKKPIKDYIVGVNRPTTNDKVWIIVNGFPVIENSGNISEIVISFIDITSRINAENELIKAKERAEEIKEHLQLISDNLPVFISHVDKNQKYLFANKAYADLRKTPEEEIIGKTILQVFGKKQYEKVSANIEKVLSGKMITFETIFNLANKEIYIQSTYIPEIKNTEVVGFFILAQDITKVKKDALELIKAKEKAEEKEEKFKLLNRLTSEMLLLPEIESIYKFIAENLQKHYPHTIILTSSVDESNHESRLEIISGLKNTLLNKVIKVLGFNPVGRTYKLTEIHNDYFKSGNFIEFDGGLAEFSASELPEFAAKAIEKLIGLHKIYTIGINKDDELLATIHFFTFNEQVISDGNFIEVFVKQAGLVIQKKIDEQTLKIAKEKEEESKKRFKSLLENAPDGVAINDIDGRLIYASPNAFRHFGYSENEIIGHFGYEFTHPDDLDIVYKAFDKIVSNPEQKATAKYRFRKRDGEYRWIETTFTNLLNNEIIKGFVLNFNDITEKKQTLEELVIAKEKAEESDRLKSAFLANMSHEIRTPMNGILGFAELLKEPQLTGDQQIEYINIIKQSGDRMLNIINDIIDISKIESGQMTFVTKDSNISEQLKYIYTFFKSEAEHKGITFIIKNSLTETQAIVKTDREKLFAILTNLVKNAIKYTDQGSIELGCKPNGAFIEFSVKDSGIGIPKNRQMAIFERFIQADIEDSRAFQGAGLGLAITKSYVEMLGGKIWVESEEGKGSTFYFTIPYNVKHNDETNIQNIILPNLGKEQTRNLKILIAEDDETSRLLISKIIKSYSQDILFANDGFEAIEVCKNNPDLDVILMDIKMPKIDGYEATKQIRKFNKDVVIISQTAFGMTKDREKALESGCNDYISKPIKQDILLNLLQKYFS